MTYEIGQRVGAAGNQAATVLQGIGARGDLSTQQIADLYADLLNSFVTAMECVQLGLATELGATPVAKNPQAIPPAPAQYEPFPAAGAPPQIVDQAAAPAQNPAPMPGVADGDPHLDTKWRAFFKDPSAWYDNRNSKTNPKQPDFRSKTMFEPDGSAYNGQPQKAAIWVNDKQNPSWVPQLLQQAGY